MGEFIFPRLWLWVKAVAISFTKLVSTKPCNGAWITSITAWCQTLKRRKWFVWNWVTLLSKRTYHDSPHGTANLMEDTSFSSIRVRPKISYSWCKFLVGLCHVHHHHVVRLKSANIWHLVCPELTAHKSLSSPSLGMIFWLLLFLNPPTEISYPLFT